MTKIITISTPKGGVGKTTTTINLAASLAIAKKSVLMIDLDPSGSVSEGVGLPRESGRKGVFEILSRSSNITDVIHHLDFLNLDLIPCGVHTNEQEKRFLQLAGNRIYLKSQLNRLRDIEKIHYDYILIDTPPLINDLTYTALTASSSVLIPLQCGQFAFKAAQRMIQTVEKVHKSINSQLSIEGILLNFFEDNTRVSKRVLEEALEAYGSFLLKTRIPKNTAIGYAVFKKLPVALVDIHSSGSIAYKALAEELLAKHTSTSSLLPSETEAHRLHEAQTSEY